MRAAAGGRIRDVAGAARATSVPASLVLALLTACSTPAKGDAAASADSVSVDASATGDVSVDDVAADAALPDAQAADASDDGGGDTTAPGTSSDATIEDGAAVDSAAQIDAADVVDNADTGDAADAGDTADAGDDADATAILDADAAFCQSAVTSITDMPLGSVGVDFETCTGCGCCNSDGSFPATMAVDCLECAPAGALAKIGATLQGGMLTTFVTCVTGNAAAPLADHGLFVGGGWTAPNGVPGLEILLNPPAKMFGFAAVPTSSEAKPAFVLRGYDAAGVQVAEDSFVFSSAPGGGCATVNPAAQFFGFRPCSDAVMVRVVVETTDANVAIDHVRIWRP